MTFAAGASVSAVGSKYAFINSAGKEVRVDKSIVDELAQHLDDVDGNAYKDITVADFQKAVNEGEIPDIDIPIVKPPLDNNPFQGWLPKSDLGQYVPVGMTADEYEKFLKALDKVEETSALKKVDFDGGYKGNKQGVGGEGGTDANFTWKLRGEDVTLADVTVQDISYVKCNSVDLQNLRNEFNTTTRKEFLEDLGKNVEYLKNAGFSDIDILKIQKGRVPDGWQVHHKFL